MDEHYLCYDFAYLTKISTPADRTSSEEVFDQACTDIVTHFLELFVDFFIVFIVLDELDHQCAVC